MTSTPTQGPEPSSHPVHYQPVPTLEEGPDASVANISTSTERKSNSVNGAGQTDELLAGYPLRRFTLRTLLLLIVPAAVTAYFCVIEWFLITRNADSNQYGHRNALWVYYSWFIIGVFGLGISKYGLVGVEMAMLQDRHWQVNDAMVLLMHSGQSWSGFSGWIECLQMSIRQGRSVPQRLWYLLSFLSLMITIALPISGLSMELYDGFVQTDNPASVIGHSRASFHERSSGLVSKRGELLLQAAVPPTIPGAGVAYTPQYLDRSQYSYLEALPNSLPIEEYVPELFLAPQAQNPVRGSAWGLRLGYNCSVVTSASDFTMLGVKPFHHAFSSRTFNLLSYMEVATQINSSYRVDDGNSERFSNDENRQNVDVFEFAFWQMRLKSSYEEEAPIKFNNTVDSPISGMGGPLIRLENGTYQVNDTFFNTEPRNPTMQAKHFNTSMEYIIEAAPPVGVRCRFVSETGMATLDPDHSEFHDFVHTPAVLANGKSEYHADPLGSAVPNMLFWNTFESSSEGYSVYERLFQSTNSPPPEAYSNDSRYHNFLLSHTILQAVIRAFGAEALQLMYDGMQGFELAYIHENLTDSKPGKILGPGSVPATAPIVLLIIWSVGCIVLGVAYGFRRRAADTLDGYSFFRFGANLAEDVRGRPDLVGFNRDLNESEDLRDIPGLIGDSRPGERIGHIELVSRKNVLDKNKLYM
ncbi:hypothetical protein FQN55_005708 [Onygenales sp. PD_40]|nr:hypothetical protein FQN55_005708 [Onygenales sp. PD_40]